MGGCLRTDARIHPLAAEAKKTLEVAPGNIEIKRAMRSLLRSDKLATAPSNYQSRRGRSARMRNRICDVTDFRQQREFCQGHEAPGKAKAIDRQTWKCNTTK